MQNPSKQMINLQKHVASQIKQGIIQDDVKQSEAIQLLHKISTDLQNSSTQVVKGLFLWGDVGRGKTWLMDQFYETLPIKKK